MAVTYNIIEGHPIWNAIEKGASQTCSIKKVIEELDKAGYYIIAKSSLPVEMQMTAQYKHDL